VPAHSLLPVADERPPVPGPNPAADLTFSSASSRAKGAKARPPMVSSGRGADAARGLPCAQTAVACVPAGVLRRRPSLGRGDRVVPLDIDWARERLHVRRTWSEDGGRIERCKTARTGGSSYRRQRSGPPGPRRGDGARGSVKDWEPEQRQLVFPKTWAGSRATGPSWS